MNIPSNIPEAVSELKKINRFRRSIKQMVHKLNTHVVVKSGTKTVDRHPVIVAKEQALKDEVIDAVIEMGTKLSDRDQLWKAVLALQGPQFIGRATDLFDEANTESKQIKVLKAAVEVFAWQSVAAAAELEGLKNYRDPAFARPTEEIEITEEVKWIDLYNNGNEVTREEVIESL